MARKSVVFLLPEGPRRATTSPLRSSNETPFKMSFSPSRLCTSETTRFAPRPVRILFMQAHPQAQRHGEAGGDEHDVDDGKSGDGVDGSGRQEGHDEGPDHLGYGAEQVDRRRVLAHED